MGGTDSGPVATDESDLFPTDHGKNAMTRLLNCGYIQWISFQMKHFCIQKWEQVPIIALTKNKAKL